MLNIVLFGAPGCGKGTQAAKLVEKYNLNHISTGAVIRSEINAQTELGKSMEAYISRGELAPDQLVIDIVTDYIDRHRDANGNIFDGFPRTTPQAEAFDKILTARDLKVDVMIYMDVPTEELVQRILLRGQSSGRADDANEEVIRNRIQIYNEQTAVVADYYNGHLIMGAEPTIFNVGDFRDASMYIAYAEGKEQELISYLTELMKEVYGIESLEYSFLKDDVNKLYDEDRKVTTIYNIFAVIAIIISCLGLFGISLFDIRQRYREIGIRKVNGAGMKDLYRLLFRKYFIVLGISFVVATPIAYYLIYQYTADFVVKAPISIGIFVVGLLLVSLISFGTLYWQIRKAANINPADVVKSE